MGSRHAFTACNRGCNAKLWQTGCCVVENLPAVRMVGAKLVCNQVRAAPHRCQVSCCPSRGGSRLCQRFGHCKPCPLPLLGCKPVYCVTGHFTLWAVVGSALIMRLSSSILVAVAFVLGYSAGGRWEVRTSPFGEVLTGLLSKTARTRGLCADLYKG